MLFQNIPQTKPMSGEDSDYRRKLILCLPIFAAQGFGDDNILIVSFIPGKAVSLLQTETVFLDFREFPFFLFAFITGIMLVDSHFAAFSLYPQRLFYSADVGGSDAFVHIQDISPCFHIVKQSAARKSGEIAPHPSAFNFFSCRKFFPHIEMGFGIVYEILTLSDLPALAVENDFSSDYPEYSRFNPHNLPRVHNVFRRA